ncbi:hypothetical protein SDC9_160866 [bioreactor metagenome]|uniref:Uncharacterized protein n=1 Tax=bioreactor metagenome TaxID=1076179 RepID=A0A645FGL4_9ZZZZ
MEDKEIGVIAYKEPVGEHERRKQQVHDYERSRPPARREEHQRQQQAEDGPERGRRDGERARRMAQRVHRQHAEGGPVEHVGDGIVHREELEPDRRGDDGREQISAYGNRFILMREKHQSTITYLL